MTIRKILIVDDDEDIRLVSELAVRRIGRWDVVSAATGEEALDRARSEQPDAILLDVMMPGTDGPTTLAMLREEPRRSRWSSSPRRCRGRSWRATWHSVPRA